MTSKSLVTQEKNKKESTTWLANFQKRSFTNQKFVAALIRLQYFSK